MKLSSVLYIYIYTTNVLYVSTNGEQASPAQQGSQLIGCHFFLFTTADKHANIILIISLPEYLELVYINAYLGWHLAHRLLVDTYP